MRQWVAGGYGCCMSTDATPVDQQSVQQVRENFDKLSAEIRKVIVGQDEVVTQMLMAIFCRGHVVVVGVLTRTTWRRR